MEEKEEGGDGGGGGGGGYHRPAKRLRTEEGAAARELEDGEEEDEEEEEGEEREEEDSAGEEAVRSARAGSRSRRSGGKVSQYNTSVQRWGKKQERSIAQDLFIYLFSKDSIIYSCHSRSSVMTAGWRIIKVKRQEDWEHYISQERRAVLPLSSSRVRRSAS